MEITVAEYFDDRAYRITEDNQEHIISSVSTRLGIEDKPFLLKYYAQLGWDQARKLLHESQDRGKRIHFALWVYLNGGKVIFNNWQSPLYSEEQIEEFKKECKGLIMILKNQDEMVAMWKLQQFFNLVKPRVLSTEETVYSIEDDIAGTLDMALEIEKGNYDVNGSNGLIIPKTGVYICDLKTGNQISDSAWAQMAAYAKAFEVKKKVSTLGAIVLHTSALTKKGIEGFSSPLKTSEELIPHYEIFKSLSYVWKQRNPNFHIKVFQFPTIIQKEK